MHCTNCGTYIAPNARFCAGCGAPAVDPEATRFVQAPPPAFQPVQQQTASDVERQIFKTRPTLLFIKIGYGLAALGSILIIILLAAVISAPWWIALPIALALLVIPAYYHLKRNMVQYVLTNHKLEIDEGFLARTTRNFPLRNIQDVTVSSTIMQRLLGYGNVVIDNASDIGGETILKNIQNPRQYADMLLRELRRFR